MKWKVPLSTVIDGQEHQLQVESAVKNNQWVITVEEAAKDKLLTEPLKIHFSLEKKLISYEPITSVNRKVAPYIADDLIKFSRYW